MIDRQILLLSRREPEYRLTSYASRDMRVSITDHGLAVTPAPANWADALLAEVDVLDDRRRADLLGVVTRRIGERQHDGADTGDPDVPVVPVLRRVPPSGHRAAASLRLKQLNSGAPPGT